MIIYAAFGYPMEYSYLLRAPPGVQMETATATTKAQWGHRVCMRVAMLVELAPSIRGLPRAGSATSTTNGKSFDPQWALFAHLDLTFFSSFLLVLAKAR